MGFATPEPPDPRDAYQPPRLKDAVVAALDASPKVREDWRHAFKFRSIQWLLIGVVNAVPMGVVTYYATLSMPTTHALPAWAAFVVSLGAALGAAWGVMTKQRKLNPPQGDEDSQQ